MLDILRSIWEIVQLLWQFVANMIISLAYFVMMIPTYMAYIVSLIDAVPAFATAFFTAGISLTIILFMMNRTE